MGKKMEEFKKKVISKLQETINEVESSRDLEEVYDTIDDLRFVLSRFMMLNNDPQMINDLFYELESDVIEYPGDIDDQEFPEEEEEEEEEILEDDEEEEEEIDIEETIIEETTVFPYNPEIKGTKEQ